MEKSVYDFTNYHRFLKSWIAAQPKKGRGCKLALAEAINCQPSIVSQIIKEEIDFTLEQAQKACEFLQLTEEDSHYFLLLVHLSRAGSQKLKTYYQKQIDSIHQNRMELKNRIAIADDISIKDKEIYYSSSLYQVIHLIIAAKLYTDLESIKKFLQITKEQAADILNQLEKIGLIERNGNQYSGGTRHMHLEKDSPLVNKMHLNWRVRSMQALETKLETDVHFTSCCCLSEEDIVKFKAEIYDLIEAYDKRAVQSKPEAPISICIDFFKI